MEPHPVVAEVREVMQALAEARKAYEQAKARAREVKAKRERAVVEAVEGENMRPHLVGPQRFEISGQAVYDILRRYKERR